jgi:hypothetical protein
VQHFYQRSPLQDAHSLCIYQPRDFVVIFLLPYKLSLPSFLPSVLPSFCPSFLPSFLPSPRRYSSGWALASWIIIPHFSLFFICSDNEASDGRMKKWEECGWKRSWPTYFRSFSIHSIHPRLIIWFLNNLVLYGVRLLVSRPNLNLEDQGIPLRLAPTP